MCSCVEIVGQPQKSYKQSISDWFAKRKHVVSQNWAYVCHLCEGNSWDNVAVGHRQMDNWQIHTAEIFWREVNGVTITV